MKRKLSYLLIMLSAMVIVCLFFVALRDLRAWPKYKAEHHCKLISTSDSRLAEKYGALDDYTQTPYDCDGMIVSH